MQPAFYRHVSLADIDAVPSEQQLLLAAEMVETEVTIDQPAQLAVTMTNTADSPQAIEPDFEEGASSAYGPAGLLLVRGESRWPPTCVQTGDNRPSETFVQWAPMIIVCSLSPDESTTQRFTITDDPTVTGCLPLGQYRFESPYRVEEEHEPALRTSIFRWGFSIEVTDETGTDEATR